MRMLMIIHKILIVTNKKIVKILAKNIKPEVLLKVNMIDIN